MCNCISHRHMTDSRLYGCAETGSSLLHKRATDGGQLCDWQLTVRRLPQLSVTCISSSPLPAHSLHIWALCATLWVKRLLCRATTATSPNLKMVSLVCSLRHHTDELSCCAFSPSLLATCSADKTLRVYDTADFSELPYSPLSGHAYGVHCCRFSSCGGFLVSCSTDGSVIVWSSETGEAAAVLQHPGRSPLRVCALAPDSSLLLAGACDGTVSLWDFRSRTLRRYSSQRCWRQWGVAAHSALKK